MERLRLLLEQKLLVMEIIEKLLELKQGIKATNLDPVRFPQLVNIQTELANIEKEIESIQDGYIKMEVTFRDLNSECFDLEEAKTIYKELDLIMP